MLREYWLIPDVCNALLTFRLGSVKVTLHGFNMFCEVLDFLFMYILIEWQRERDKTIHWFIPPRAHSELDLGLPCEWKGLMLETSLTSP